MNVKQLKHIQMYNIHSSVPLASSLFFEFLHESLVGGTMMQGQKR